MKAHWRDGNAFELLENGEQFFPAVFGAIGQAEREVIIQTFILFEDKVGLELQAVLIAAARRGVRVDLTIDGWGSPDLSPAFIDALTSAGVALHVFDPIWKVLGRTFNGMRRMHRKIAVIDARLAFVGGINYSADHLADFGPQAKQDYAVACRGPIVQEIHRFARAAVPAPAERRRWFRGRGTRAPMSPGEPVGSALALFVTRDNHRHRSDIERQYRLAIRGARRELTLANAYFFPGYRLLRGLRRAAQRGVNVRLILQGEPDMAIAKFGASMLYDYLLRAGVHIHEYRDRPLHGKVAYADDEWATVGSSNLDPLSLSLNLEANVVIRDRGFNAELRAALDRLVEQSCKEIVADPRHKRAWWRVGASFLVFHFLRRFAGWAAALPAHQPKLASVQADGHRQTTLNFVPDEPAPRSAPTGQPSPPPPADGPAGLRR